jgi:hypothetical protein
VRPDKGDKRARCHRALRAAASITCISMCVPPSPPHTLGPGGGPEEYARITVRVFVLLSDNRAHSGPVESAGVIPGIRTAGFRRNYGALCSRIQRWTFRPTPTRPSFRVSPAFKVLVNRICSSAWESREMDLGVGSRRFVCTKSWPEASSSDCRCLLLHYLFQSCLRGGRGIGSLVADLVTMEFV